MIEVILNGCRELESFIFEWFPLFGGAIDSDRTTSNVRYVDVIGSGKRSHEHLTYLSTTRYTTSLLQDWSFPSLTALDFDPSPHNNIDDLKTHLVPFLTRSPRLYRLSYQIDQEVFSVPSMVTIDNDSKQSSINKTTSLQLPASCSSLSSAVEGGASISAPFVIESLRTLTLRHSGADYYEPIIRAASIGLQTIKWLSIDSTSLDRFVTMCSVLPMTQLSTLYFTKISFHVKDTSIWKLLFETLPHLMTLILPEDMVPKVRGVAKTMTPIPRVNIVAEQNLIHFTNIHLYDY
jgi:hypothetical protein